jgi:hypothetical protein
MSRPPIQNVLELIHTHTHIRDEVHTQFEKLKKEKKQEMANWISNSQIARPTSGNGKKRYERVL